MAIKYHLKEAAESHSRAHDDQVRLLAGDAGVWVTSLSGTFLCDSPTSLLGLGAPTTSRE
jgi:hypothetical protein